MKKKLSLSEAKKRFKEIIDKAPKASLIIPIKRFMKVVKALREKE